MTRHVTVSETNSPSAGFAESFARLLLERERLRPALALVENPKPAPDGYKLPANDPSRPVPAVV